MGPRINKKGNYKVFLTNKNENMTNKNLQGAAERVIREKCISPTPHTRKEKGHKSMTSTIRNCKRTNYTQRKQKKGNNQN